MGHSVFVSYSTKVRPIADRVVKFLEDNNIKCWYAPRNVSGDYATSIVNGIENTKVLVVLVEENANNSPHVLNEINAVYDQNIEKGANIKIIPVKLDNAPLSKAMDYYIKRMHWVNAVDSGIDEALISLKKRIEEELGIKANDVKNEKSRNTNVFYLTMDDAEINRLRLQQNFLMRFDGNVYKDAINEYQEVNILDIGTADGSYISRVLSPFSNIKHVLGVDYNEKAINKAKMDKKENYDFILANVEEPIFESILKDYLAKNNLPGFTIINISMVLLHLKYPEKLLRVVRHYLIQGGTIIIKDIDDDLRIAYPDKNGLFERAKHYSINDQYNGYRFSGRQIPYFLHKNGYQKIELVNTNLSTIGMTYDEKEGFFDFVFPYFVDDYRQLFEKNPKHNEYKDASEWFVKNLPQMKEEFMEEGFYFNLGTVLFKAKR